MPFIGHWYALVLFLLINFLFWGGLVFLIVWAIHRFAGSGRTDSALTILKERFAKGEIDQQEYETRKAALSK